VHIGRLATEDTTAIAELDVATRNFADLREQWEAMAGLTDQSVLSQLVAKEQELKEALKTLPYGDPSETTTAPRHRCDDAVVRAHGAVTQAVIEAELARSEWEVQQLRRAQDQSNLSSALINSAVLRLRMFDIDGAYEELQQAAAAQPGWDSRLELLTRYTAQLKGPRHPQFMQGDLSGSSATLLAEIRQVFLANKYTVETILMGSKASSMSEFIFVESRADALEQGLLENVEEKNPMKENSGPKIPVDLVDLVRIFLLHRVLPLARLCQLFGPECTKLLLQLRAISAIAGNECRLVEPEEAAAAVDANMFSCGAFFVMSNIAIWPVEEDLLVATDFEKTFSSNALEPVMYISEDSLALVAGAPREAVTSILDLCCGSGVQGIVALRHYASNASFVDLNPRSPHFVRFNLGLNCLADKVEGVFEGNLYDALPQQRSYDAIVANPPFVPNPQGIASGAGAMFGNGGDTGEKVLEAILRGASRHLSPTGRLAFVAMSPNVQELPQRINEWCDVNITGLVFSGTPTPAPRYQPTSSGVETSRYQAALERMGVTSLSEVVGVMVMGGNKKEVSIAGEARPELWADHSFLRMVVQKSAPASAPATSTPPPPPSQKKPEPKPTVPAPVTSDPSVDPYAAATNAAAAVSAATTASSQGEPQKQAREGNLPGFQPGFFPGYCQGPSPAWEPTARELHELATTSK